MYSVPDLVHFRAYQGRLEKLGEQERGIFAQTLIPLIASKVQGSQI